MTALPLPAGPVLLDGAMGTALRARGLPPGTLPERWVLERPDEVAAVHRAHAAAGAGVLLTCTFNAASARGAPPLAAAEATLACARAVELARAEAGGGLVAGALGPLALASPGGAAPTRRALAAPFLAPLQALAAAGADLLWLESQYDEREALAALGAALPLGPPVVLTLTLAERGGRLVLADGRSAEPLLAAVAGLGAAAVGVNCVAPGPALEALAAWARGALPIPFVAKPSPGLPGAVAAPGPFAAAVGRVAQAGARWVGGCCGADAGHLRALAGLLAAQAAVPRG